jgi:MtN3 and saliva related transmembrane protein
MDGPDFVGLLAAVFTTAANVPQVIKTYRRRSGAGLSSRMLMALSTGLALWLLYGLLRRDISIILANAAGLSLVLSLLIMKWRFKGNAPQASDEEETTGMKGAA